jgi:hypothetical protein
MSAADVMNRLKELEHRVAALEAKWGKLEDSPELVPHEVGEVPIKRGPGRPRKVPLSG